MHNCMKHLEDANSETSETVKRFRSTNQAMRNKSDEQREAVVLKLCGGLTEAEL